ncbi:hypothetical protein [Millisia brevis]|uniref:hypothetical protein n=1 Tax=Millisia brevis TaxID=264148 RepID=UPI0008321822|nr:hypothetical protein [Millisia brevis]
MTNHTRALRTTIAAICCAAALATAGCTITVEGASNGSATTTVPPVAPAPAPAPATGVPGVTAPSVDSGAAQRLCSDIGAQLSNWRIQGPTLGRGGFNLVVQSWAAASGGINLGVLTNRTVIDDTTQAYCPDIRSQTLDLLDIPTLAAGLVGL